MTYGPAAAAEGRRPNFDNVFVNRESYRQFMSSGKWPDKTIFILEIRGAEDHVSINNGGQTQGSVVAIEAAVKDPSRFRDTTWAYFNFGAAPRLTASAAPLPASASCYTCHRDNTAVEQTFVQFYPTLFDVARRMGTVKPTYDPAKKALDDRSRFAGDQALVFLHRIDVEKRPVVVRRRRRPRATRAPARSPWPRRADRRGEACRTGTDRSAPDDRARRLSWDARSARAWPGIDRRPRAPWRTSRAARRPA